MIWRFTAASYIIIDDFEAYTGSWEGEGDHPLDEGWADYYANGTNALITLQIDSPVLDKQSMEYAYDNPWLHSLGYCSEAQSLELDPTDWAAYDVNVLTLWFYGWPDNDVSNNAEQMYLSVIDDDGLYAELRYGDNEYEDMNDLKIEAWQRWDIPLTYFSDSNFAEAANDVNLADVNMLIIGFGERNGSVPGGAGYVYFDDIQLNPPFCDTKRIQLAEGDLNVDCAVDFEDVEIMANEWLKGDVNFPEVSKPCEPNLVGWWKLNESDGNDAADSSGKDHHGTLEINDVNVYWVVGYDGNNALEFTGGRVRVPDHQDLRPLYEVSACAWINFSEDQRNARVVVKGPDNRETYGLEVHDDDEFTFYIREANDDANVDDYDKYDVSSNELEQDEWAHIAGTFDGNTVKCYINGELKKTLDDPNAWGITLSQDTNDLAIGSMSDNDRAPFVGTIDDVRVYDYGLSAEEIAWLATDGKGIFEIQSVANLYDDEDVGERVVNFKDLAKLAKDWLKEELFPQ
jgi:hypothetical protein